MIRLLTGVLLSLAAGLSAIGQTNADASSYVAKGSSQQLDKAQVTQLITRTEMAIRDGEAAPDIKRLVVLYSNLGILYEDVGMYLKAEDAIHRAIALLKDGPPDRLADEVEQLATLHLAMKNARQAEKDEMEAMRIRKSIADLVGIAQAESSLAGLYDEERRFAKALDYAEKAYDVLADRNDVALPDRIGVRYVLGYALTNSRACGRGIQILKDALQLAQTSNGADRMGAGYGEYLLGLGYWRCGDREHASEWLGRGTMDMRADYGWDQAMYVNAMNDYAHFLRETGQREAAESAEAVVNQAESVVDASTLTGRAQGFRSAGSK
jgi:tetratricopeptide (TPR) repeat protein